MAKNTSSSSRGIVGLRERAFPFTEHDRRTSTHLKLRRARDPLVDLAGSRKEIPKHRTLRCQARELGNVLREAHAAVRGAHAKAVLAAEKAFGCGGDEVQHLLRVYGRVELVGKAVNAIGERDLEPISIAAEINESRRVHKRKCWDATRRQLGSTRFGRELACEVGGHRLCVNKPRIFMIASFKRQTPCTKKPFALSV